VCFPPLSPLVDWPRHLALRGVSGQFGGNFQRRAGPPLAGGELCCAQGFLRNEGPVRVRGGIGAHFQCGVRGLRSECRGLVPGTVSVIGRPETNRRSQSSRATHGSPPARGGLGGGARRSIIPPVRLPKRLAVRGVSDQIGSNFQRRAGPPWPPPGRGGTVLRTGRGRDGCHLEYGAGRRLRMRSVDAGSGESELPHGMVCRRWAMLGGPARRCSAGGHTAGANTEVRAPVARVVVPCHVGCLADVQRRQVGKPVPRRDMEVREAGRDSSPKINQPVTDVR